MKSAASVLNKKSKAKEAALKTATLSPLLKLMDENSLRGKDILAISELDQKQLALILSTAALLKEQIDDEAQVLLCKGQTLAMLFEKPSLRTRVTFEVGMKQLGGHAIFLEGPLGLREPVSDVAKNLDRWVDGIMARTFAQNTIIELADNAEIPVINGLSDLEHPCQALADLLTIQEHLGGIAGKKIAYIGDPNNVSNSLLLAGAKFGANCFISCPPEYMPDQEFWNLTKQAAAKYNASLSLSHDPEEAALGADVIYTDTWVSMGQESEAEAKEKIFTRFQVNSGLLALAKSNALVMHCLPAHRGFEISAELIDGPNSVILDQAENRLHAQKAILALVL